MPKVLPLIIVNKNFHCWAKIYFQITDRVIIIESFHGMFSLTSKNKIVVYKRICYSFVKLMGHPEFTLFKSVI